MNTENKVRRVLKYPPREAHSQLTRLTERELEVVECAVEGLDAFETADQLGITVEWAFTIRRNAAQKLGVTYERLIFLAVCARFYEGENGGEK